MRQAIISYLIVVNILAFILYGLDKSRAKRHRWRIPERTLLGIAALGGSLGAYAGMSCFRHKTKHTKFSVGIPVMIGIQLMVVYAVAKML
ncbi:DUF1294 domain-containing protein [Lachnospiraceae bacterium LCP25S3_G4]